MSLGDYLTSFTQTAGNIYGSLQQAKAPATAPAPTVTVSNEPNWQKYLPIGIGAVVLLVIVGMVTRK